MPRFAANLSLMFTELEPIARIQAAKDAGFEGIEYQFTYDLDIDELVRATEETGVSWSVINIAPGRGITMDDSVVATPGWHDEAMENLEAARKYVAALKPKCFVIPAMSPMEGVANAIARETLAKYLKIAGDMFGKLDTKVLVEPLNPAVRPRAVVTTCAEAWEIIEMADHPNLGIEYDAFHLYITEGEDMAGSVKKWLPHIGNIQFADVPGRGEPGSGDIDYDTFFEALDEMGYDGWTAAEYTPSGPTTEKLGWFEKYKNA